MKTDTLSDIIRQLKELKLREARLLDRLEKVGNSSSSDRSTSSSFVIGDRVRIRNQVRKPSSWTGPWIEAEAKAGIVTAVDQDRIALRADNGTRTWRAPKNLERIEA